MHICILPDHQNQVLKNYFVHLWSGRKRVLMQFQATIVKSLKNYFSTSGVVKTGFDAFPDHQIQVLKKLFFNVWNGQKRVFMHLRIFPNHQNQVLKNFFVHLWSG